MREVFKTKLTGDLTALYAGHMARYLFPIITIPYLARVLGVEAWGVVVVIQAYAVILSQGVEFGFGMSATRHVARNQDDSEELATVAGGVLGAQVIFMMVGVGLTALVMSAVPVFGDNVLAAWIGATYGLVQGANVLWFFRGLERLRLVAALDVAAKTVALVLLFLVVRGPDDVWKVLATYLVGSTISLVVGWVLLLQVVAVARPTRPMICDVLRGGWSLFLVRASGTFFSDGNIFVLGLFVASAQVGIFGGALKIVNALRGLLLPGVDAMFPRLSHLVANAPSTALAVLRRVFWVMVTLGMLLTALAVVGAPLLVNLILGNMYAEAIPIVRILAWLSLIVAFNHVLGSQWMVPLGLDRVLSRLVVAAGLFNLGLSVMLLSLQLGDPLRALATVVVVTQALLAVSFFTVLRMRRLDPFRQSIRLDLVQ